METIFSGTLAFLTLVALELILGIDNIVIISILSLKLPTHLQDRARKVGLGLAVFTRVLLLLSLTWLIGLVAPLFTFLGQEISARDLILIAGGLFLIAKSTHEIYQEIEGSESEIQSSQGRASFSLVVAQILLLDIVFSLDSVITAVAMANNVGIMIAAVLASTLIMFFTSGPIASFVKRNPTIKMLALSLLLLVGATLVAEGFEQEFPKSYIYFAMGFSFFIELLNIRARRNTCFRGHRSLDSDETSFEIRH